jgi:endonuclease/exonuclease/phosphatase family metal-dependent hydrolase
VRLVNFHGIWKPGRYKGDTEERLLQSDRLIALSENRPSTIFVGDFNLLPDTASIAKFEGAGFQNLIRKKGVLSTRTRHYPVELPQFADYAFVRGAEVVDFRVLPDVVSDHAPLLLEIEA